MLKGRLNRAVYWVAFLFCVAALAAIRVADPKATISEVVIIFLCVPRLHDIGKSGWFVTIPIFFEIVAVGMMFVFTNIPHLLLLASELIYLVFIAVIGVLPGDAQSNRFGDRPKPGFGLSPRRSTTPTVDVE